eukprot:SAG11_NODE_134_length_15338_cov_3.876435_17_plen_107_part_00
MQHGYTMDEVPIGSIRLSLQPPVAHTCINHKGSDQQCDPDSPNYAFDFSPERPPYCADPDRITNPATMRDVSAAHLVKEQQQKTSCACVLNQLWHRHHRLQNNAAK